MQLDACTELGKQMKTIVSGILAASLFAGAALFAGAGAAQADEVAVPFPVAAKATLVNPIEEARSMCIMFKSKTDCSYLMENTKMGELARNCLIKAGIGGAATLIIGRYVSKDLAEDIAAKVVVTGSAACLSSLA
ncbi:hypothetical protein [Streptomyces sp. WAC06614]|uniref:hypothetical protein n=1 Tax=Streptomyces sp. WAC06614 TaxID=2487416 RepID=UPI000F7AB016|nr:hypothetical protein [Streptomyces sp. WAC06614]RSS76823.1 hypothetical protein EF918_22695 [Streptomyces sp. WAC06614]